jgi:peptidoglycan/xylan/chitin deacetylase (PgdA/CDA1 family)
MAVKGGAAQPISEQTSGAVKAGPAIPVYGYTGTPSDRPAGAGPARPVKLLTDADLRQNGGAFVVAGTPAEPMYDAPAGMAVASGPAQPIYLVGGALTGGGQTVTLPQNLITNPGTIWDDFEADASWSLISAVGSHATDTTNFKTGTASEQITTGTPGTTKIRETVAWNLSAVGRVGMWAYFPDAIALWGTGAGTGLCVYFQTSTGAVDYYRIIWRGDFLEPGWNWLNWPMAVAALIPTGSPNIASIIRMMFETLQPNPNIVQVSLDTMTFGIQGVPAVLLRFDDGSASQYNTAYQYMKNYKMRGTLAAQTNAIGTGGYCTWAQLREMDSAGWSIANHTNASTNLTTLTEAQQETQISGGKTALVANGLSRCADYLVFPGGNWDVNTVTAMTNLGVLAAQTTYTHTNWPLILPKQNLRKVQSTTSNGVSLATLKGYVDTAIAQKTILPLHFHDIGAGGGELSAADFQSLIDYIAAYARLGQIYSLTIDDLYKLQSGSIQIPRPI